MANQTWYIAVVRTVFYKDDSIAQTEVARIGPLSTKQLEPILKKIIYRGEGAIRIFQCASQGLNIR